MGSPTLSARHAGHKFLFKLLRNLLMNNEPLRRDTGLTVVDDPGLHRGFHGLIKIGAGHHDKRIAAAKFQTRIFLIAFPAAVATLLPAPTLPVSVTAAMRRSAITLFTRSEPISNV